MDVSGAANGTRDPMCIEVVELVTEYLDGALPDDEVVRLERHIRACDGCVAYVEQFRQLIETAGHVGPEAVPAEAMERLLQVYREYRGTDQ